jgi:hypothetical protein
MRGQGYPLVGESTGLLGDHCHFPGPLPHFGMTDTDILMSILHKATAVVLFN